MRQQIVTLAAAGLMTVSSVAAAEISANVAFTNDYRFRGISQTDEDFAVQGGFDYTHESGFYAGTWASTIDSFNPHPVTGAGGSESEVDIYAGFGGGLTQQLSWDFNVLYFYYPGAVTSAGNAEIDFVEFTPGLSYETDAFAGSFSVSYSPDYFGESDDSYYYNLGVDVPVGNGVGLGLHAGYQSVDDNAAWGTPDYADWSVSLSKSMGGLDWSVAYVDTDLDGSDCFGGPDDICAATAVVSVGKSL